MTTRLFLLTLLIATVLPACKKKNNAAPAVSYTSHMGGIRNWHGSHYYDASGMHFPTSIHEDYDLRDTAMAVTIVDDTTVQFLGSSYVYDRTDTANQIHFFGTAVFYFYYHYPNGTGIAYYYSKDSIAWCYCFGHGTNDFITQRELEYTY